MVECFSDVEVVDVNDSLRRRRSRQSKVWARARLPPGGRALPRTARALTRAEVRKDVREITDLARSKEAEPEGNGGRQSRNRSSSNVRGAKAEKERRVSTGSAPTRTSGRRSPVEGGRKKRKGDADMDLEELEEEEDDDDKFPPGVPASFSDAPQAAADTRAFVATARGVLAAERSLEALEVQRETLLRDLARRQEGFEAKKVEWAASLGSLSRSCTDEVSALADACKTRTMCEDLSRALRGRRQRLAKLVKAVPVTQRKRGRPPNATTPSTTWGAAASNMINNIGGNGEQSPTEKLLAKEPRSTEHLEFRAKALERWNAAYETSFKRQKRKNGSADHEEQDIDMTPPTDEDDKNGASSSNGTTNGHEEATNGEDTNGEKPLRHKTRSRSRPTDKGGDEEEDDEEDEDVEPVKYTIVSDQFGPPSDVPLLLSPLGRFNDRTIAANTRRPLKTAKDASVFEEWEAASFEALVLEGRLRQLTSMLALRADAKNDITGILRDCDRGRTSATKRLAAADAELRETAKSLETLTTTAA